MRPAKWYIIRLIVVGLCALTVYYLYSYGKSQALSKPPQDGNIIFTVKLDSIDLVHNHSVGNSWEFEANINGKSVKEGDSVEVTAKTVDRISLSARAEEIDSIPDIGKNSTNVTISNLNMTIKNKYPIEVTISENRGRYSGNTAKWRFVFTVERKVNLSDIVANIF